MIAARRVCVSQGNSLNAYLLDLIEREVARPTIEEVLDRAARRAGRPSASALDALGAARGEREDQAGTRPSA